MGAWGTGLYQGDYAADLKEEVREVLSLPLEVDRLLGILREDHPEADEHDHERYPEFWLVVQDQFHAFGIQMADAEDRAIRIIRDGVDLEVWRDLDGSEANIRRRAKTLDQLLDKWATPRTRTLKRKIREDLEPFVLNIGDVVAVNYGRQLHERYLQGRPPPDRWGAFIVLNRIRLYGVLPRYAVAQLTIDSEGAPPDLDACIASDIDNTLFAPFLANVDPAETFVGKPVILPTLVRRLADRGLPATRKNAREYLRQATGMDLGEDGYLRQKRLLVFYVALTSAKLENMHAELIGRVKLDGEKLGQDFPFASAPNRRHVERDHAYFDFIRRVTRISGDVFVAGFSWPIAQYVDRAGRRGSPAS